MKWVKGFIFLGLLIVTSALKAQSVEFKGDAPGAVIAGDKFRIVYTINKQGSDFRLPSMDGFQILMGPSTSQNSGVYISNGKAIQTLTITYTYILKCDKPGKYTINPASIVVDGDKIESNSLTIEVIKGESGQTQTQQSDSNNQSSAGMSNDDLFIKVSTNKNSVYKDEPLVLTTKLYVKPQINVQGASNSKLPDLKGFLSLELKHNSEEQYETIDGKTYVSIIIQQKLIIPQKSGKLVIDPTEIEFIIRQRVARRSRSVFDDFFESNYRQIKKNVTSEAFTINVKPLPGGAPADFAGIVGDVTMNASISKTNAKTNDGITIKVNVSGTGNHKLMSTPELNIPSDFDIFDPKVNNNFTNTPSGMKGTKSFEYLIIPRHSGEFIIPPVTISYFDIKTKRYKQLTSKQTTINVEKGSMEETPIATSTPYGASREELKFLGKDIRYIKTGQIKLKPQGVFLFGSTLFLLLLIIPTLLFILFIIIVQKRIKENANINVVKNKKANKLAQKRLKQAHVLLKKGEKEAFYDEVLRAMWGYMSDKLTLPVAQLSKENASTLMANFDVNTDTINKFMEILDTCEFARYAPASGSAEMDKLYRDTIDTITVLENQIKK